MRTLLLILALSALACNDSTAAQPTTHPSPPTTPRPTLRPVDLHYSIYLARHDLRITVSADGLLRSVRTDNKTYGPNDLDPKHERVEVREGQLTAEQTADLARLFANWDALSPKPYPGVPDGGDLSLRYGDKTVSGGSAVPKQVTDIRLRLTELAQSMPVVKR